jgi:hypothetical protein
MIKVSPAQIQKYLMGVRYPVTQEDLVHTAQLEGADDNMLSVLRNLPLEIELYYSPADVSRAIGLRNEI